ncbi:ABC transporter permease [Clostridium sp. MSJ-11]|uniref:ABC transporter permease n=1 Tax=Clostridium mobile TaxID=2841512 RepID=A0ABS6ELU9_9CLOT|nr:ABC transporter permease [Clostridium mobile]MBU5485379.1 ABC transporter permease [Clostridium mobile]
MFRVVKKSEVTNKEAFIIRATFIIFAFLAIGIFIAFLGFNPISVYATMIKGAFGSSYSFKQTLIKAIPLLISALGISVAFKMKFWNIGGEGQIIMGAFLSSYFALNFPELNSFLLIPIMILAGVIGGALWAFIPAVLKWKWGTNETIVTLMMNYIALKFVTYLQYGPWKDPTALGFPKIPNFSDNGIIPEFLGIHIGWLIALLLVACMYIFMNRSKKGYEISILGESEKTALYAGVNIKNTLIFAMLLSGGLCGLVGMIQASGVSNTLSIEVAGGVGYTAITIAWLSNLNSIVILIVSVLFAALVEGGSFIQTAFNIPEAVALIIQSTILFFILGSEFFLRYKLVKKVATPIDIKEVA